MIETDNGSIKLEEGEGTVIPKGVKHKPRVDKRAVVLLLEPFKVNTEGD